MLCFNLQLEYSESTIILNCKTASEGWQRLDFVIMFNYHVVVLLQGFVSQGNSWVQGLVILLVTVRMERLEVAQSANIGP